MSLGEAVGWAGNACFFSRFLLQWLASERAKRTVAPVSFWWISLIGTVALGWYSVASGEPVLLAGYLVNGAIYARNLMLRTPGKRDKGVSTLTLVACAALAAVLLFSTGVARPRADWASSPTWFAVALVGQTVWSGRFLVQWWMSERRRESHFPVAFWWLSLFGNALLLAYAFHIRDPIFIAGYAIGPVVQVRNLMLARRASTAEKQAREQEPVLRITPQARRTESRGAGQGSGRNAGGVPE